MQLDWCSNLWILWQCVVYRYDVLQTRVIAFLCVATSFQLWEKHVVLLSSLNTGLSSGWLAVPALGKHVSNCKPNRLNKALCHIYAVGRPIKVEKKEKPTAEELDVLHQLYMDELSDLFEEHKGNYGVDKDTHLNFV